MSVRGTCKTSLSCLMSVLVAGMICLFAASRSAAEEAPESDLLCEQAPTGMVEPIPQPFNYWMVIVCGPQSQALVPIEGTLWLAHGSNEPVSILALPPGATSMPTSGNYNPSYSVRFKSLYAANVEGEKWDRSLALLRDALTSGENADKKPNVDHIFQLDAVSSIYDMRYNIYFYVTGTRPFAAIVCIDACQRTLLLDIAQSDPASKG